MKKIFTIFSLFFLCSTWSFAQNCTIGAAVGSTCTFLTDGDLIIPAGVTMITVEAWGAGGGASGTNNKHRAGGGGGAYFFTTYSVAAGTFQIVVGQGGLDLDGGDTSFDIGGAITVGGGKRNGNNPGLGGVVTGGVGTDGGAGGKREQPGTTGLAGGGGGGSGPGATAGGDATSANGGTGGAGGTPSGADGGDADEGATAGGFPGGGGGGTGKNAPGGTVNVAGGNGQVIVTVTAILPVELVRFNANAKNNRVSLEWQTASEINNEGFEIQKSKDGITWDILDFVEGRGTSEVLNTYESIDKLPNPGANYYRLKQLDFDGEFAYSKIVSVDFNQLNEVGIFPNPVKSQLTLTNGAGQATIYNALGQTVKQLTINANQATIQLADLLNGQYYLQVLQADGTVVTKQFSKMN